MSSSSEDVSDVLGDGDFFGVFRISGGDSVMPSELRTAFGLTSTSTDDADCGVLGHDEERCALLPIG